MISQSEWRWFGNAGHFICSRNCQFHLCTVVGDFMVSTVGEYVPDEGVREIIANSRGIRLQGKGDERLADYMEKIGYESIGFRRTYETMVFKVEGVCDAPECDCGQPMPKNWQEVDSDGYNSKFAANDGHYRMCLKFASMAVPTT